MQNEQQSSETFNVSSGEVEKNRFDGNSAPIFKDNSGQITLNYLIVGKGLAQHNLAATRDASANTMPSQENRLDSNETTTIKDELDSLIVQRKELEVKLEYIELQISRIEAALKSEIDPSLSSLLHWLSSRKNLAEKYGKIALRGFQGLKREAEAKGDLDDFYFEVENYLELISFSLEKDDKVFLQESIIFPTFADPDIYENASSEIYKEVFRILKENIPRDNIESSLRSKLEDHFNELHERLQAYF